MKKVPTQLALGKFVRQWRKAQDSKNVPQMEKLLKIKWLNYWWYAYKDAPGRWKYDCLGAIEIILQRAGLIAIPPERPSERAMRIASEYDLEAAGRNLLDESGILDHLK